MDKRNRNPAFGGRTAVSQRNSWLLIVALSFLAGCLSSFSLASGPWLWALAGIGAALILCLRRMGVSVCAGILLCVFALGVLWTHAAFFTPQPEPGTYEIRATVYGGMKPRTDNRISFVLSDIALDGVPTEGRAYCSLHYEDAPPALFDGARVCFSGRVYLPDGPSGAPHMDFRLWMRQQRLSFCIAAYREVRIENTPETAPAADHAYRLRRRIRDVYERLMGPDSRVPMALLLGERDGLAEEEYQAFQTLGMAHLMSVSGLHVALLGGLLMLLLERLRTPRVLNLALLTALMGFYCWLTGFSAAANRAAVMLLLAAPSRLCGLRPADGLTTLAGGMLAVLLINPLHASSAGFVLSFSAMLGIVLYAPTLRGICDRLWPPIIVSIPRREPFRTALRWFQYKSKQIFVYTLTAQFGVLLPTAFYFYQLPLYGVFINLLLVPLVTGMLLPLYALLLPLSVLPRLSTLLGTLACTLTDALLSGVSLLSTLPYAALRVASPPGVLCVGIGFSLVTLSRRVPASLRRRALTAALVALVASVSAYAQRSADLRYIQLSVGQADSALLMDGDQTVLIDTGVDASSALDYLLHDNRNLDALILTHLHTDHAGGLQTLLDSGIRIRRIYVPANASRQKVDPALSALLEQSGIPVSELASGDVLRYNKAALHVLWPERETVRSGQDANLYAMALEIDLDGFTLLQMSDVEGLYEAYAARPADVLKVAHHGSSDSTGEDFLRRVSPRCAIISASSSSRSLPGADTLERLDALGIETLRTDQCGDITLSVQNGVLTLTPFKGRQP